MGTRSPCACPASHANVLSDTQGVVSRLQKRQSRMKLRGETSGSETPRNPKFLQAGHRGSGPLPGRAEHRNDPTRGLLGTPSALQPWEGPPALSSLPDAVRTHVPQVRLPPRKKRVDEKGYRNSRH